MTTNMKYLEMTPTRGRKWNEEVRESMTAGYNNSCLPEKFRGKSPHMVNTVIHLGWNEDDALALLNFADKSGDHPDWSEADWDELLFHFQQIEPLAIDLGDK
ncbi:MAG: hypothetical protein JW384_01100 [Nitrosomonadaceae bacterium]|jgi:hypothetical protein|nr:hypothetical protein [Nitrosomonadaceae bacterium]